MTKDITPLKVVPHDDDSIISINERKRLGEIQKKFPNQEIIIGGKDILPEKSVPVTVDLAEMEHTRMKTFDAATESIMGQRVDRLQRGQKFPLPMVTGFIGFLLGVATCFFVYNI